MSHLDAVRRWLRARFPAATLASLTDGKPVNFDGGARAHRNHVHWAMRPPAGGDV